MNSAGAFLFHFSFSFLPRRKRKVVIKNVLENNLQKMRSSFLLFLWENAQMFDGGGSLEIVLGLVRRMRRRRKKLFCGKIEGGEEPINFAGERFWREISLGESTVPERSWGCRKINAGFSFLAGWGGFG